jgi:hypothetical protein
MVSQNAGQFFGVFSLSSTRTGHGAVEALPHEQNLIGVCFFRLSRSDRLLVLRLDLPRCKSLRTLHAVSEYGRRQPRWPLSPH